jgi:hypothetical protein
VYLIYAGYQLAENATDGLGLLLLVRQLLSSINNQYSILCRPKAQTNRMEQSVSTEILLQQKISLFFNSTCSKFVYYLANQYSWHSSYTLNR